MMRAVTSTSHASEHAFPLAGLQHMRETRRQRVVQPLDRVALSRVQHRDLGARGDLGLVRVEHARDEHAQHIGGCAAGATGFEQMACSDFRGAPITLEHQVFAVRDVVVHRAARHAELRRDFRERSEQHAFLVQLARGFVQHALVLVRGARGRGRKLFDRWRCRHERAAGGSGGSVQLFPQYALGTVGPVRALPNR